MNDNDESNIKNNIDENIIMNNIDENDRTLIVGSSFCGTTHLLLNKLQLFRLDNPEQKIKIITRSPEQYENIQLDVSVEEDLEDRTKQDFHNCCVVFNHMLDSNQKLIDFLLGEDMMIWMFIIYHSHTLIYLKEQLETIRLK